MPFEMMVLFVFLLDLRGTFISSLALPTSVIGTFFVMYALGYTLNQLSLFQSLQSFQNPDVDYDELSRRFYQNLFTPLHTFYRIRQVAPELQMAAIDLDWLKQYLAEHPRALEHRFASSRSS